MLKLRENGLTIDYMYETNSVLRKTAETEISDLTFWLRFGSVRVFINRNRTEIRFPHIPNVINVAVAVLCSRIVRRQQQALVRSREDRRGVGEVGCRRSAAGRVRDTRLTLVNKPYWLMIPIHSIHVLQLQQEDSMPRDLQLDHQLMMMMVMMMSGR